MDNYRLSRNILPTKYIINIEPIGPDYNYFKGKCIIFFSKKNVTNKIVLNAYELKNINVYLYDSEKSYYNTNIIYNDNKQKIKLIFESIPKNGTLIIEYIGKINEEPIGLCKAIHNDELIFYTHFEPIYARKCFPCFDEPNFKATFNIEIISPKNKFVISNSTLKDNKNIGGKILHKFNETPPMSTYLVAFYIGNIEYSEGKTLHGINIRIFTDESKKYREYILENTIRCMDIMTNYFKFPYPIPKLDIIYVPKLEADAMENWGLIIVKQSLNNYNDRNKKSEIPLFYKIKSIYVIIHELTHQWFGNIVTLDWWSDIWLNESFATWFGWFIMNNLYPSWKSYEEYYTDGVFDAFQMDYLLTSHAIIIETANPKLFINLFDAINYSKGSAVINMIVSYIGMELFMKSIRYYIKKFQFNNANTNDFINCLEYISKQPIKKMTESWLKKKNYPIVNVSLLDNNMLFINQEVFIMLTAPKNTLWTNDLSPVDSTIWTIPLTNKILLDEKSKIININDLKTKINKDAFGFYLVNYDPKIIRYLLADKFGELSYLDVAEMLNNLFMCLRSNRLGYNIYLELLDTLLQKLKQIEPNGLLTKIIMRSFFYFNIIVKNNIAIIKYKKIITPYVNTILEYLGLEFKDDDDENILNSRISALDMACSLNIKKYVDYCNNLFDNFMEAYHNKKNTNNVMNDYIKDIVVKNAIVNRTENDRKKIFDFLLNMFDENNNIDLVIPNISSTIDIDNYYKALNFIYSDKLNNYGKLDIINKAGTNGKLNIYLWPFIKENWEFVKEIFSYTQFSYIHLANTFKFIVDVDNTLINDIELFFSSKKITTLSFARSIEYIMINTNFNNLF